MSKRPIEAKIVNPLIGTAIPAPTYATDGSAAMDLRACLSAPIDIPSGDCVLIPTGLAVNIQDTSLAAIVASRSGLALKNKVFVLNAPGIADSDYQGEIGVILANFGPQPFRVEPGDRIAQLMFQPVVQVDLQFTEEFSVKTQRGTGGFGSTGTA